MTTMTIETLRRVAQDRVDSAHTNLVEWVSRFALDSETGYGSPAYALEWGERAFDAAAQLEVYGEVLAGLGSGASLDDVRGTVIARANQFAKQVPASTSLPSNHMNNHRRAVWCQLSAWMQGQTTYLS